jgi:hypothetical protein
MSRWKRTPGPTVYGLYGRLRPNITLRGYFLIFNTYTKSNKRGRTPTGVLHGQHYVDRFDFQSSLRAGGRVAPLHAVDTSRDRVRCT